MSKKARLIAELKDEHGIDVMALLAQAADRDDMRQLTASLTEALRPLAPLPSPVTLEDVTGAVAEIAEKSIELDRRVRRLERKRKS